MEKILQTITPRITKRLVVASLIFWLPLLLFAKLAEDVFGKEPILIDQPIAEFIWKFTSEAMNNFMLFVTHGGDTLFIFLVAALLVILLSYKRSKRDMLAVIFSVGGAGIINVILKLFFQRERPNLAFVLVQESTFSFPSGHAMGSSALGFTLIIMLWRTKWRWLAVLVAASYILTIGISRIYLGAHFPSDVVAGWCVSAVWVLTVYIALEHPGFVKRNVAKLSFKK